MEDGAGRRTGRAGGVALALAAALVLAAAGAAGATEALAGPQAPALGGNHVCALTEFGGVRCWGSNSYGQLGDGTRNFRTAPGAPVPGFRRGALAVAAGREHSCALAEGGAVWCWGRNDLGQLGDGTRTDRLLPVRVKGGSWGP